MTVDFLDSGSQDFGYPIRCKSYRRFVRSYQAYPAYNKFFFLIAVCTGNGFFNAVHQPLPYSKDCVTVGYILTQDQENQLSPSNVCTIRPGLHIPLVIIVSHSQTAFSVFFVVAERVCHTFSPPPQIKTEIISLATRDVLCVYILGKSFSTML